MRALLTISRAIDGLNRIFGVVAIYLVLFAALLSAANAGFRYGLNALIRLAHEFPALGGLHSLVVWYGNNSNALLEAQWYMFAGIVLLGAAWTLKINEHVRVDLFYGWFSERTRVWIDLLGALLFLLPMCAIMIWFTWPWFHQSWMSGEMSSNAGGLIRWPAKLMLPLGFFLLGLQGLSEIIKCVAALTTGYRREYSYERPLQ